MTAPRIPEDTAIETARAERNAIHRAALRQLRTAALDVIAEIEAAILARSSDAGATNPEDWLDYVERLIAARVVERTLTP
jgi:hypothetical protein